MDKAKIKSRPSARSGEAAALLKASLPPHPATLRHVTDELLARDAQHNLSVLFRQCFL